MKQVKSICFGHQKCIESKKKTQQQTASPYRVCTTCAVHGQISPSCENVVPLIPALFIPKKFPRT